jgi:predicted anti-sigma-YlaC factor YlaD
MNCTDARDLLLEADLMELSGEVDTDLSRHIRACAGCRAAAELIAAEQQTLARALSGAAPRTGVEEAVRRAGSEAHTRDRVLPFRPRRWWAFAPLAAAAALVAILFTQNGGQLPGEPIDLAAGRDAVPVPTVEASSSQNVAVFDTENPDIVVVWIF